MWKRRCAGELLLDLALRLREDGCERALPVAAAAQSTGLGGVWLTLPKCVTYRSVIAVVGGLSGAWAIAPARRDFHDGPMASPVRQLSRRMDAPRLEDLAQGVPACS